MHNACRAFCPNIIWPQHGQRVVCIAAGRLRGIARRQGRLSLQPRLPGGVWLLRRLLPAARPGCQAQLQAQLHAPCVQHGSPEHQACRCKQGNGGGEQAGGGPAPPRLGPKHCGHRVTAAAS